MTAISTPESSAGDDDDDDGELELAPEMLPSLMLTSIGTGPMDEVEAEFEHISGWIITCGSNRSAQKGKGKRNSFIHSFMD